MLFKTPQNKIKELEDKLQKFEKKLEKFDNDIQKEFEKFDEVLKKTEQLINETFGEYQFTEIKVVESSPETRSYTQKEIAKLYGVNHHTVQKWEKGYYPPKEFIGRANVDVKKIEQLSKEYRERKAKEQERIANKKNSKKSTRKE